MQCQRELIERNDWSDIILFDGGRYDIFAELIHLYFDGEITQVWNGDVAWTHDWFSRMFRKKYPDVCYYSPSIWEVIKNKPKLKYPKSFGRVVGGLSIPFDNVFFEENSRRTNKKIIDDFWFNRRVIHYWQPHPPFPGMPFTQGKSKSSKCYSLMKEGKLTTVDLTEAYIENCLFALKAAKELIPHLGDKVIITADHGECLGDCGQLFHGQGHDKHNHLVNVFWFEIDNND